MQQREVYDHLADIYLDASNKKKKKSRPQRKQLFKYLFTLSLIVIFGLIFVLSALTQKRRGLAEKDIALVIEPGLTRINFNFDRAKKEALSFDLTGLDLRGYKTLGFFARKSNRRGRLHLRLEINNEFAEQSEFYLNDLSARWRNFKINLADFKDITNWANISKLRFVIEEWNSAEKRGMVYIDNISFFK